MQPLITGDGEGGTLCSSVCAYFSNLSFNFINQAFYSCLACKLLARGGGYQIDTQPKVCFSAGLLSAIYPEPDSGIDGKIGGKFLLQFIGF